VRQVALSSAVVNTSFSVSTVAGLRQHGKSLTAGYRPTRVGDGDFSRCGSTGHRGGYNQARFDLEGRVPLNETPVVPTKLLPRMVTF